MKPVMFTLAIILAIVAISNDRLKAWWLELPADKMVVYFVLAFSSIIFIVIRSLAM